MSCRANASGLAKLAQNSATDTDRRDSRPADRVLAGGQQAQGPAHRLRVTRDREGRSLPDIGAGVVENLDPAERDVERLGELDDHGGRSLAEPGPRRRRGEEDLR